MTQLVPNNEGRLKKQITDPGGLNLTTSYEYDANGNKIKMTDPRGNVMQYEYDGLNRLIKVIHQDRSFKSIVYDLNGNKIKITDEIGNIDLFEYDALNRVVTTAHDMDDSGTINSSDIIHKKTYNKINLVETETDPEGNITSLEYDDLHRLVKTISPPVSTKGGSPSSLITQFVYEVDKNPGGSVFHVSNFKPTRTIDPRGFESIITYDKLYRPIEEKNEITTGQYGINTRVFSGVGNILSEADPLGKITVNEYDALNRLVVKKQAYGTNDEQVTTILYTSTGLNYQNVDALGRITEKEYDLAGRDVKLVEPFVNDERPVTTKTYDENSNPISATSAIGNTVDYEYDVRNRLVKEIHPEVYDAENDVLSRPTTTKVYNGVGKIISVTDARGNTVYTHYDKANRAVKVISPAVINDAGSLENPITETIYDKNDNIIQTSDPNGNTVINTYDGLNRLISTTDAENIIVSNEYDEVGNKTAVVDGGGRRSEFTYDGLNRNTQIIHGAGSAEEDVCIYNYDTLNKTSKVDGNGSTTLYFYDHRHRLKEVRYEVAGTPVNDSINATRFYTYDLVGNLVAVSEPSKGNKSNIAYAYDGLDRLVKENQGGVHSGALQYQLGDLPLGVSGGETHVYVYDHVGNRTTNISSTGRVIESTYDSLNRLSSMIERGRVTNYLYDLNSNIQTKSYSNGDICSNGYDALNRKTTMVALNGANDLYQYDYVYDLANNLIEITEDYPESSTVKDRTIINSYDRIYRLTQELVDEFSNGSADVTTDYVYDDSHNRIEKNVIGGTLSGSWSYSYNSLNQIITTTGSATLSYTYDENGNRLTKTENNKVDHYTYDIQNRLVGLDYQSGERGVIGQYEYAYDYRTRRVERNESAAGGQNTKMVYSGGTTCHEEESGKVTVEYIRGSDYGGGVGGVLYTLRSDVSNHDIASYTHNNHRGDIVAKTDSSGSLTYQAAYEAFGSRTQEDGSTQDRQKANSKDEDLHGLLNEGFRYRDLETGTFITRDPAGFIDGPNLYTYVVQNPWSKFDPEGLSRKNPPFYVGEDHHKVTRETILDQIDNGDWNNEITKELEKLKAKAGKTANNVWKSGNPRGQFGAKMPRHAYNLAHIAYNERSGRIVQMTIDLAKSEGQVISQLSQKESANFARLLVQQIDADKYCRTFNAIVSTGRKAQEINRLLLGKTKAAQRKALGIIQSTPVSLSPAFFKNTGKVFGKMGSKVSRKLGPWTAAAFILVDLINEGPLYATENAVKSATMFDVFIEPIGEAHTKTFNDVREAKKYGTFNNHHPAGRGANRYLSEAAIREAMEP